MSTFKLHELKITTEHFTDVLAGGKTNEVRVNDRDFKVGDCLNLREIDQTGVYTGQEVNAQICHILHGGQYGIEKGYCVLSLANTTHIKALHLIAYLRDRLQETCDCIETSYELIEKAGCTTTDAKKTVTDARLFVDLANDHLDSIGGQK